MSTKWDKKYSNIDKRLIEDLAELRHNQIRGWSRALFEVLNEYQYNGRSLDDFMSEMLKLCKNNWVDYDKLDPALKIQSRTFAYAIIDIIKKYNGKQ